MTSGIKEQSLKSVYFGAVTSGQNTTRLSYVMGFRFNKTFFELLGLRINVNGPSAVP